MSTTQLQERARVTRRVRRGVVAVAAIVSPVIIWTLAVPLFGIEVRVPETPGSANRVDLELIAVVSTATVAVLAGWALLAALERFTRNAHTIWTVIALAVFVLTLPYLPGFTVAERVVLGLIHLTLAAVLIPGMRRTGEQVR